MSCRTASVWLSMTAQWQWMQNVPKIHMCTYTQRMYMMDWHRQGTSFFIFALLMACLLSIKPLNKRTNLQMTSLCLFKKKKMLHPKSFLHEHIRLMLSKEDSFKKSHFKTGQHLFSSHLSYNQFNFQSAFIFQRSSLSSCFFLPLYPSHPPCNTLSTTWL